MILKIVFNYRRSSLVNEGDLKNLKNFGKPISWADHSWITNLAVILQGRRSSFLRIHYSEPEIFLWWRVSALRIFPFLSFLKFRERVNGELRVDLQNVALPWIPLGNLCWAHFLTGCQQVSECGWVSRGGREEGDRTGSSFNLKNYFFYFHIFWVYRYICV